MTKRCSCCGKKFYFYTQCMYNYVYKINLGTGYEYQCSYTCWRKEHKRYGLKEWETLDKE